jgi:hypothetical protein
MSDGLTILLIVCGAVILLALLLILVITAAEARQILKSELTSLITRVDKLHTIATQLNSKDNALQLVRELHELEKDVQKKNARVQVSAEDIPAESLRPRTKVINGREYTHAVSLPKGANIVVDNHEVYYQERPNSSDMYYREHTYFDGDIVKFPSNPLSESRRVINGVVYRKWDGSRHDPTDQLTVVDGDAWIPVERKKY